MDKIKYIKLELPDGTFSESIPISVDARFIDISENFNLNQYLEQNDMNINTLKFDTSNNDGIIHGLTGGNPLAADSVESMSDTDHVYVNTDDGYWYYYNSISNQWVQGGIYQTAEDWKWEDMHDQMSSELESVKTISTSLSVADAAEWNTKIGLCGDAQQNLVAEVTGTEVEGINITISDYDETKESKFNKFSGNTEQQTYTGKNSLPYSSDSSKTLSGVTITQNNGIYTITNTATGANGINFALIKSYTIKNGDYLHIGNDVSNSNMQMVLRDSNDNNIGSSITLNSVNKIVDLSEYAGQTASKLRFYFNNSYSGTIICKTMIVNNISTATDFEPYVGGKPSPNPDYPQDIKVVTGNNTIEICNKNLFDGIWELGIINGNTGQNRSNDNYMRCVNYIPVKELTSYKFSSPNPNLESVLIYEYKSDYTYNLTTNKLLELTSTLVTNADTKFIRFRPTSSFGVDLDLKVQVEEGNSVTDYIEHQSQSYSISLGSIELCKIGNYQDYIYKKGNNWYKYSEIGKVVLDGTQNWSSESNNYYFKINDALGTSSARPISNRFLYGESSVDYGTLRFGRTNQNLIFNKSKEEYSTVSLWNAFFENNNTTVYYELATPTETKIIDTTLINQLNAIVNAQGYQNITYIKSNKFIENYQQIEYIEATTGNQYIDTGWTITENTGFEVDFSMNNLTQTQRVLGSNSSYLYLLLNYQNNDIQFRRPPNQQVAYNITDWSANIKYNLKYFDNKLSLDGIVLGTYTPATSVTADSMYLFRYKGTTSGCVGLKIYRFKITENGVVVRDFIPCRRISDSAIGLYDIINQQFYENAGSGAFTPGPIVYSDWPAIIPNYKYNFINVSPSPEKPSEITVVSGQNQINIDNENLFDEKKLAQQINRNTYNSETGLWTTNSGSDYRSSLFYGASGNVSRKSNYLIKVKPNTYYTLKVYDYINNTSQTNGLAYMFYDKNGANNGGFNYSTFNDYVILRKTPNEETYLDIARNNNSGTISFSKILLVEGQYEQNSMPNFITGKTQQYPLTLSSRNKLSYPDNFEITKKGITIKHNEGIYIIDGLSTGTSTFFEKTLHTPYTIQDGDYIHMNNNFTTSNLFLQLRDSNGNTLSNVGGLSSYNTIYNLNEHIGKTIVSIILYGTTGHNFKGIVSPMIINSGISCLFEPYTTNIIELAKVGEYQDLIIKKSDGWYKYSEIKKITNAETLFYDFTIGDDNKKYVKIQKSELYMTPGLLANRLICNKFREQIDNTNRQPGEFISNIDTDNVYFVVDDSYVNLDDVQTNLTDVTIYAAMANATEVKITDATLIDQLNIMKNHAATYQGISHIMQINNTDLPIQLDIDYKKSNVLRIKALEESLSI